MDKRWKAVERKTAAELNQVLSGVGKFSPIERIPLLGRDGPDLTINELGLVVNVKSRKVIPERLLPLQNCIMSIGPYRVIRLQEILKGGDFKKVSTAPWKMLTDWYEWMDEWTKRQQQKNLASCIIIHRPGMPVGHAGVVVHHKHFRRFLC